MCAPRACSSRSTMFAIVLLPEAGRPVNQRMADPWPPRRTRDALSTSRFWRWMFVARRRPKAIMPAPAVAFVKRSIRMNPPSVAILGIRVEGHGRGGVDVAEGDLVQRQRGRREMLERVDVDLVLQPRDARGNVTGPEAHQIRALGQHRLVRHPDDMGGELVDDLGAALGVRQHVAARDVDVVREGERHRLSRPASARSPSAVTIRATEDSCPEDATTMRSPGRTVPDTTVPESPRKSRFGRLTHCTGNRKGFCSRARAGSSVSRSSSSVGPSYQGERSDRIVTLSPKRADRGMDALEAKPSPRAKPRYSSTI